jgi:hypothetical protein
MKLKDWGDISPAACTDLIALVQDMDLGQDSAHQDGHTDFKMSEDGDTGVLITCVDGTEAGEANAFVMEQATELAIQLLIDEEPEGKCKIWNRNPTGSGGWAKERQPGVPVKGFTITLCAKQRV